MSNEDEFIYQLLSCKSTEYQESFNFKDDTNILAHSATKIIQEVQNTALREGCESHLGALLSTMLDQAPYLQGQRYVAIVLHVARRHSPEMVIEVAKTWRSLFLDSLLFIHILNAPISDKPSSYLAVYKGKAVA